MKLVSTPYRWLPHTYWENVSHWFWDIKNGLSNLPKFFAAVWWFRCWDWTGTIQLLKVSAEQMLIAQKIGRHTGAYKEVRRLTIVVALCERMLAEEYLEAAGYRGVEWDTLPDYRKDQIIKHCEYMEKQDTEYLCKTLKFIKNWWE